MQIRFDHRCPPCAGGGNVQGFIAFVIDRPINRLSSEAYVEKVLLVLDLHLKRNCRVYVIPRRCDNVLTEPAWVAHMADEDYRG